MLAHHLDRQFRRLGARVGEEDRIGEGRRDQPLGQRLLLRDLVEVRDMPDPPRLRGQRGDEGGVRMPERVDRDPRAEVEVNESGVRE
jgi:hypothetical protein